MWHLRHDAYFHCPPWPLQALRSRVGRHRSNGTLLPHAIARRPECRPEESELSGLLATQELGIQHSVVRRAECARLREWQGEPTARSKCCPGSAELGSYASSGRAMRLRAVRDTQGEGPGPWSPSHCLGCSPTAFEAAETTAFDHIGANRESPRSARSPQTRKRGGCEQMPAHHSKVARAAASMAATGGNRERIHGEGHLRPPGCTSAPMRASPLCVATGRHRAGRRSARKRRRPTLR